MWWQVQKSGGGQLEITKSRLACSALKIAGAHVENKRLAPGLAIFMLSGAPTAHEVLSEMWNRFPPGLAR